MSVLLSVTAAQLLTQMMFDFIFLLPSTAETEPSLGPVYLANKSACTRGEGKLLSVELPSSSSCSVGD